jgi:hypothetical protein
MKTCAICGRFKVFKLMHPDAELHPDTCLACVYNGEGADDRN